MALKSNSSLQPGLVGLGLQLVFLQQLEAEGGHGARFLPKSLLELGGHPADSLAFRVETGWQLYPAGGGWVCRRLTAAVVR